MVSPLRSLSRILVLSASAALLGATLAACGASDEDATDEPTVGRGGGAGSAGASAKGGSAGDAGASGDAGAAGAGWVDDGDNDGEGGSEGWEDGDAGEAGAAGDDGAGGSDAGAGGEAGAGGGGEAGASGAGGAAGGTGGAPPAPGCTVPPGKVGSGALLFDGKDDSVTMGNAKALGLATFTVEAWVRRDGDGVTMSTGVGGLHLVPIAGKGRGESDGTNVDCNYAFGFVGDKIAVDFEDMATGGNHPLVGGSRVPRGEWHHVATTFDGKELRLYVDGKLDAKLPTTAKPRSDSIQHFAIGRGMNSKGEPAGAFDGAIDEVRVWSAARTAAEISDAAFTSIGATTNLVSRWDFEKVAGGKLPAVVGSITGTLSTNGPTVLTPGAPIDLGRPATIKAATPTASAAVPAPSTDLTVTFDDADSSAFDASFYLREITDADDFTIVVLPDTQYYVDADRDAKWKKHFFNQTDWIVDNRKAYNIVAVIHNGDITDDGQGYESEWKLANQAMTTLEDPTTTGLKEGIPYGLSVGNHDNKAKPGGPSITGNTGFFNEYFGVKRFSGRTYYGGHYGDKNDENFITFTAGGLDFVVVSYQYVEEDSAYRKAVLQWGRKVFDSYPNAFGIVNSHYIVGGTGKFGAQGKAIYDSVANAPNVHLMTCGHVSNEKRRTDTHTASGHSITSMLADYQALGKDAPSPDVPSYEGGSGYMRIWEFSPKNNEVTVRTYSPSLKKWQTDKESEFTIKVDLTGAGGAFKKIATPAPKVTQKSATIAAGGLKAGSVYEWYATIDDCNHKTRTAVQRFKVSKLSLSAPERAWRRCRINPPTTKTPRDRCSTRRQDSRARTARRSAAEARSARRAAWLAAPTRRRRGTRPRAAARPRCRGETPRVLATTPPGESRDRRALKRNPGHAQGRRAGSRQRERGGAPWAVHRVAALRLKSRPAGRALRERRAPR